MRSDPSEVSRRIAARVLGAEVDALAAWFRGGLIEGHRRAARAATTELERLAHAAAAECLSGACRRCARSRALYRRMLARELGLNAATVR